MICIYLFKAIWILSHMHQIKSLLPLLPVSFYVSSLRKSFRDLYIKIDTLRACLPWPLEADVLGTRTWFRHWEGTSFGILASFFFFSMLIKLSHQSLFPSFSKRLESPVSGLELLTDTWRLVLPLQKSISNSTETIDRVSPKCWSLHSWWQPSILVSPLELLHAVFWLSDSGRAQYLNIMEKEKKKASHTRQSIRLLGNRKLEPLWMIYGISKYDWCWLKPSVASDFTSRHLGWLLLPLANS